ncbi:hypothetical protein CYMTET_52486 [Cymbomonas tetramitiformis]|uniref:Inosine/uridine-preferring nucleoside hydrolase domain-containing protein n=1 Tax=Cymbomonas tetramitiformis TaxID=36881 RepID=A0AAE0BKB7_9CHLO|nr:hypothetical protein CYMTET_52486 [Cymbomonas tetramitiformis]
MTEQKSVKRQRTAKKIIIDTDPGVDDTMAILLAFNSPEVEVIGLTTIFGNVRTPTATRNAIHLCELAGKSHIPVAQGADRQLRGNVKERIATFVHGDDGLGNTGEPFPTGKAVAEDAADFLAHHCRDAPGEITIVALGPLTNLALAMQRDAEFPKNAAEIVVLGGALFCNGNVNPAAEANIFGDPDAADLVFTSGGLVTLIGLDVTQKTVMMAAEVDELKAKVGPKIGR